MDSRLRDRGASEDVVQETFVGFRDEPAALRREARHGGLPLLHRRPQADRPSPQARPALIDQFGSDDHGRPLDEVPGGGRPASSIARSDERRKAEERLLPEALGQLVKEWQARADYDRLRCLELLIVKGWANKDVAKFLEITEQAVASYKFQTIGRLKEMARRAGLSLDDLGGVELS